jgi:serine/threonine protein kinase/CRP-like cAMP-binding protein
VSEKIQYISPFSNVAPEDILRFFENHASFVRRQLPRDEIFKLAAYVTRRRVKPGDCIVVQNDVQKELIFIFSGEATIERYDGGKWWYPGKLIKGSHWGNGSLLHGQGSSATLKVIPTHENEGAEILCLSEVDFKRLGFDKLQFSARPAVFAHSDAFSPDAEGLGDGDIDFILNAAQTSRFLKGLVVEEELRQAARKAKLVSFKAGHILFRHKEFSDGAYVIRKGRCELVPSSPQTAKSKSPKASLWRVAITKQVQRVDAGMKMLEQILGFDVGDFVGQISLLQGTRRLATVRVSVDAEMYFLPTTIFRRCFKKLDPRFEEVDQLLNDCTLLSSFFKVQRRELARNHAGFLEFEPNTPIIKQDRVRLGRFWYVISSGTAVLFHERGEIEERVLRVSDHFGLREPLMEGRSALLSVRAGPEGLTCVLFEEEVVKLLPFPPEALSLLCCETLEEYNGKAKELKSLAHVSSDLSYREGIRQMALDPRTLRNVAYLGRGAFGLVILQEDPKTGKKYALKRISKGLVERRKCQNHTSFEKDLTFLLSGSAFTVTLNSTRRDAEFVYLLLDAELGGDLDKLLKREKDVFRCDDPPSSSTLFYVGCISEALGYLHEHFVAFRDLKPGNVMISSTGYAKLCDFGLSRFALKPMKEGAGTPDYMAPEIFRGDSYSFEVDWFALGVLTFELLSDGNMPFEDDTFRLCSGWLPQRLPHAATDFIRSLLKLEPKNRLGRDGARSVQEHDWMKGLDFKKLRKHELQPPFVPPEFEVSVPAPTLWDSSGAPVTMPFTEHQGQALHGGVWEWTGSIEEAKARSWEMVDVNILPEDRDDAPMGFNEANGQSRKLELKFWDEERKMAPRHGWTAYRSHADLYAKAMDDISGWDSNFDTLDRAVSLDEVGLMNSFGF